jgi:hypothetical protein
MSDLHVYKCMCVATQSICQDATGLFLHSTTNTGCKSLVSDLATLLRIYAQFCVDITNNKGVMLAPA